MASVGAHGRESLETQLQKLQQYEANVQGYKPNIEELEALNAEVQEAMIFENRHTSYTMEVCSFSCSAHNVSVINTPSASFKYRQINEN